MTQQRVSPIAVTSLLPATPVLSLTAASGQSANLVTLNNSSGTALATISASGLATFPNVAVSSTTIPANGIYLPAANTLGFATNSAVRMQIDANGYAAIGSAVNTTRNLSVSKNITGGTIAMGIRNNGVIQSDVTTGAYYYSSNAGTAASAFTLVDLWHYHAEGNTPGAGSAITNQYGFFANATLTGATNNYGFYGNIASGSNRWNFYAGGTAANYFAGQTTVGSTSLTLGSGSVAQQFGVVSAAAANIVEVIRGAASQTGDLVQWQNSSGTVLSSISSAGAINKLANFAAKGDLISASAASTPSTLTVGADATVLTADSTATTGLKWAVPTLSSASGALANDVTMTTAGTFYNGPTVTLAAGTWLVLAQATFASPNNSAQRITCRISNSSTTYYAEGQQSMAAGGAGTRVTGTVNLNAIVVLAGSTTLRIEATSTVNSSLMKAETTDNSSVADSATILVAVRIA